MKRATWLLIVVAGLSACNESNRVAPPPTTDRATLDVLYQEVYLEPIGTDIIFAAPRVARVTLRADQITVDDMGSLSVASPSARLHYIVESDIPESALV